MTPRKYLKRVALFAGYELPPQLWMDVNKTGELQDSFAWAQFTAT
jgi:hypothetical protein